MSLSAILKPAPSSSNDSMTLSRFIASSVRARASGTRKYAYARWCDAPDAAAQLVELRQAERVGAVRRAAC
jgi:hypothetical protein